MINLSLSSFLIKSVKLYQQLPRPRGHCRYSPTCSVYMIEAIELHGTFRGVFLGLRRLLNCHPFGGWGYDPVPVPKQKKKRQI